MVLNLYNLVWHIIRPFIGILLKWRERNGKDIASRRIERYGLTHQLVRKTSNRHAGHIWLHAVSVGESIAALQLSKAMAQHFPDHKFLITTNTITGARLIMAAIVEYPNVPRQCVMQPFDHPDFVDAFLTTWKPFIAIFMESDFWPNLILSTKKWGVPIIFASSQLSIKAAARWKKYPAFASNVLGAADLILPVDNTQSEQFWLLVGDAQKRPVIKVTGSLKLPDIKLADPKLYKALQKAAGNRRIFLAASTHDGEDQIIIDAARKLGTQWLTIIAPRHPNRGSSIATIANHAPQRSLGTVPNYQTSIYIMDTLGEMHTLFSLAHYVFLGGSLVPSGGHNPLEPASFGLPILTGTHIFKNKAEFDGLAETGAVFEVSDAGMIVDQITNLEADPARRKALAKATKHYVTLANQRLPLAAATINQVINTKK